MRRSAPWDTADITADGFHMGGAFVEASVSRDWRGWTVSPSLFLPQFELYRDEKLCNILCSSDWKVEPPLLTQVFIFNPCGAEVYWTVNHVKILDHVETLASVSTLHITSLTSRSHVSIPMKHCSNNLLDLVNIWIYCKQHKIDASSEAETE